jgi:stearoyl-CoA desaturase (Delta-9 desaturase)
MVLAIARPDANGKDNCIDDAGRTASPTFYGWPTHLVPITGAAIAVAVAALYGRPIHAKLTLVVMLFVTGTGATIGYHRLFAHRSFVTFRPVEWTLMVLGCMVSGPPFFWIATHRVHHRYSDRHGDPHSPHIWSGRQLGLLRGCWHSYFAWLHAYGYTYQPSAIRDLTCRPDLVWIDRNWHLWYFLGLAVPGLVGFLIGGTAYDALIGFLWGGLLRHFLMLQALFAISAVCHLWGTRPYDTVDRSHNNFILGVIGFGEGWHNNHHAFPSSARHGFQWWQVDLAWYVIWLMERFGLAWQVKRPKLVGRSRTNPRETAAVACNSGCEWKDPKVPM